MKATIEIPDDLYRKLEEQSARQGRPIDAVTIELLQRGLDETAPPPDAPGEPTPDSPSPPLSRRRQLAQQWQESWKRRRELAAELGPDAEIPLDDFLLSLPPDRREALLQLENWFRLGQEASKKAPPGPTARDILEHDRGLPLDPTPEDIARHRATEAWLQNWLRIDAEASRKSPPGPTARESLEEDRNRLS